MPLPLTELALVLRKIPLPVAVRAGQAAEIKIALDRPGAAGSASRFGGFGRGRRDHRNHRDHITRAQRPLDSSLADLSARLPLSKATAPDHASAATPRRTAPRQPAWAVAVSGSQPTATTRHAVPALE